MPEPGHTSIQRWTWDRGGPHEAPGVKLRSGDTSIFVPASQLYVFADYLVDTADAYDSGAITPELLHQKRLKENQHEPRN